VTIVLRPVNRLDKGHKLDQELKVTLRQLKPCYHHLLTRSRSALRQSSDLEDWEAWSGPRYSTRERKIKSYNEDLMDSGPSDLDMQLEAMTPVLETEEGETIESIHDHRRVEGSGKFLLKFALIS
jgi:hypothetical protein